MSKILELLIKYLGIPLVEKLGKWVLAEFKKWQNTRKIIKDQKTKTEAIDNAKTPQETRAAHRNNKL